MWLRVWQRHRKEESEKDLLVSVRLCGLMTKVKLQPSFHGWCEFGFLSCSYSFYFNLWQSFKVRFSGAFIRIEWIGGTYPLANIARSFYISQWTGRGCWFFFFLGIKTIFWLWFLSSTFHYCYLLRIFLKNLYSCGWMQPNWFSRKMHSDPTKQYCFPRVFSFSKELCVWTL